MDKLTETYQQTAKLKSEREHRAGERLRESSGYYHSILDSMLEGCQIIGFDWRYLYLNDAAARQGRHVKEELLGRTMMEMYPGIENTEMFARLRDAMKKRITHRMENLFTFTDGSQGWFELSIEPIPDGIFILSLDITERKRVEEELRKHREHLEELVEERAKELRETHERFSGVFNSSKDAIRYSTLEGTLLAVNDSFCELTGYSREECLAGKTYQEITMEEYHTYEAGIIEEILRTGKPAEYEKECIRKDGSRVPVLLTAFVVKGDEGKPIGLAAIIKDITERKRVQEKLHATERLATLGQLLGSISHELRNPLGVIDSSVYFLKMKLKDADKKVQEHLDRIKSSVAGATAIIESLLSLTRMKEPQLKTLDLIAVISDAIATSKVPSRVHVVRDFPESEVLVNGDHEQLRMTFKNIIKNAVEAMDGRGTLMVVAGKATDGQVDVSFADTGAGIAPENLDKVFQPLFSTRAMGIGFGLSIAKMVIDKHGGTIAVKSVPGKGTIFGIRLPLCKSKAKEV